MRKIALLGLMAIIFAYCSNKKEWGHVVHQYENTLNLKRKPLNPKYQEMVKEPLFENLNMIGEVGKFGVSGYQGKILRVLRFKNFTDLAEAYYGLHPGTILAMMAQESSGVDMLPNALDDGGFGLCHMQPMLASQFGLLTYENCTALVSKSHGKKLRNLIEAVNYDRKEVIKYDDRLHPLLNLDCVGRMMAHYMKNPIKGLTEFETGIRRYAGKYNYRKYYREVSHLMEKINDSEYIQSLEKKFNQKNQDLKINGEKGDFVKYIKLSQDQLQNYGFKDFENYYKRLPTSR